MAAARLQAAPLALIARREVGYFSMQRTLSPKRAAVGTSLHPADRPTMACKFEMAIITQEE